MNHFSKPPRSADEHLQILKDRNLVIDDSEEIMIKQYLRAIGYFRLSGYFGPLQYEKDIFRDGAKFDDILRLYNFDLELRHLSFRAVSLIEIELRTWLTDIYSMLYNSFWYADPVNFDLKTERKNIKKYFCEDGQIHDKVETVDRSLYEALIADIVESMEKTEHLEFMMKFRMKYSYDSPIPSWMVLESISFGKLSRLFSLLKHTDEKNIIAKHFGAFNSDFMVSWLHSFVILRNMCAHHGRLWNRKIGKDIMIPRKKKNQFITCVNEKNTSKYYGVASCMLKVFQTTNKDFMIYYKRRLHELIYEYGIDIQALGFPEDYQKDEIWNMTGI
jgi:abortive infection bacteriophage resistance protein